MDSNKFTQNKPNNWERIESVVEWADMTTNYFARYIGLPRGENLYQIKRGNNGISHKLARMITDKFPQINLLWLLSGEGDMFNGAQLSSGSKPLYNIGVEENIREISSKVADEQMVLPPNIDCDLGMLYLGRAMGDITPPNSVILLKKILPEMIIPGDECVIVTKKIVLLRIAKIESTDSEKPTLRLVATNSETYGDIVVPIEQIEAAYKVKGKILINN
ncbi:MAG: hypothetical protein SNI51_05955 [Rikenellaceae bacterium]